MPASTHGQAPPPARWGVAGGTGAIGRVGSVAGRDSPIARSSAATIAPALGQRSSGSLASPRSSTASTPRGSDGSRSVASGGSSSTWARAWAAKCSAWNGREPVSSSKATTASA